jgi:predicted mannosyl-3-phosphoglycerate phosphatase (HAD superfamily)
MSSSPVIYTDLDGTLLDHDTYSAHEAKEDIGAVIGESGPGHSSNE